MACRFTWVIVVITMVLWNFSLPLDRYDRSRGSRVRQSDAEFHDVFIRLLDAGLQMSRQRPIPGKQGGIDITDPRNEILRKSTLRKKTRKKNENRNSQFQRTNCLSKHVIRLCGF